MTHSEPPTILATHTICVEAIDFACLARTRRQLHWYLHYRKEALRKLPSSDAVRHPKTDEKRPGGTRHRLLQIARIAIIVAVAAAIIFALVNQWTAVRNTIGNMSIGALVGAFALLFVALFATLKIWHSLLGAMGISVPYHHAAPVNLVGQLGKYLPGSVWAFFIQAQLGKRYGIPRVSSFIALLLAVGVTVVTGASLGPFVASTLVPHWGSWAWMLAAGPIALVFLLPSVLTRIANIAMRAAKRPPLDAPLKPKGVLQSAVWSYVTWLLIGGHLWLLVHASGSTDPSNYFLLTAAIAIAMSAGFVAFFLPSGIGVREAMIVAVLSAGMPVGRALGIAFVSRILFTIADLAAAFSGLMVARPWRRAAEQRPSVTPMGGNLD